MNEAFALSLRAREEAAVKAQRAKDAAARLAAKERGPAPLVCPDGANEKQRATFLAAAHEIEVRERASKVARGWQRVAKRTAPAGCIPFCCLWGERMVIVAIDLRGRLRLIGDGKVGPVVTVSEAGAIASGRNVD